MKKLAVLLFPLLLLVAPVFAANNASLNGTYAFFIEGTGSARAEVTDIDTVNVPSEETLAVGTIKFNGAGTATFLSVMGYNLGTTGPKAGSTFTYQVSGNTATMNITGATVSMSLGSYNSSGVASVVIILVSDSDQPMAGIATLQ
ncbi:MAG TPA: hypothetical protein VEK33_23825 [Terriglobales bacterium]|nr:hypothetical protein [Terriglobales bacterium]